jgi:hypothetical protein
MKFNKNVLLVIFISTTIGTLSYAMDGEGFTPALSRKAQRRAKRAAAQKATSDELTAAQGAMNTADKLGDTLNQLKGNLDKERGARNVPQSSWMGTLGSNKLKAFAGFIVIAEVADLAQAWWKTKEELYSKTLGQKAELIAQKTYTAKLLGAAKDGLMNRVVPGILDLKQKAQDYLNKKKQTA